VALYAVKGYANAEIAELRGKSEATIKTQINAVFRKAGVQNRGQLIAQFLDLLLETPAS
jgi:DNA-binding CsgD family transcriptional regulator